MVGDNIKKLREHLGLTQTKFAERIGITQSTIAMVETGKSKISRQALLAISREFGVRLKWLETGEGEMYIEADLSLFAQLEATGQLTPKGREFIEAFLRLPASLQNVIVDATRAAAEMYPRQSAMTATRKPDNELTKAEVLEMIGVEYDDMKAAEKRETSTSSASIGLSGTSKKIGINS